MVATDCLKCLLYYNVLIFSCLNQTRSIASEVSQSNDNDREDSPETPHFKPASNGENIRHKFHSPKANTSLSQDDQDSPVVGVRRSDIPRDEEDTARPRVNAWQTAVNSEENTVQTEHKDSDDEQGPEPRQGEILEDEIPQNSGQGGCGVILERFVIVYNGCPSSNNGKLLTSLSRKLRAHDFNSFFDMCVYIISEQNYYIFYWGKVPISTNSVDR